MALGARMTRTLYSHPHHADGHGPAAEPVRPTLGIFSDTICPWCYIGKRRAERALRALGAEDLALTVRWRPFELNPGMPPDGVDRRTYRAVKFGSWERSQALDARVAAAGAEDGIVFRHDRIARTPNTRASHRLIWLAGAKGGRGPSACRRGAVRRLLH